MRPREFPAPSALELQAFSLGKIDDADRVDQIEAYLTIQADCCNVLATTPDDDLVQNLRGSGALPPMPATLPETLPLGLSLHETARGQPQTAAGGSSGLAPATQDPAALLAEHPRYRILRPLGEGGMGTVYLAEHRIMQRPVALKLIRTDCLPRPEYVERFRREVKAAARLSHPNIVTAHDAEEVGGTHFLVMEYVEGAPLSDLLEREGCLSAAEACNYVRQAALGLQYAHEKGMVHRDLKPQNLMRLPDGTVKILDFGLARFGSKVEGKGLEPITAQGAMMGTADYMAPEQAQDSRTADIRSDIYSLGCTLYHLLSGQVPFPTGTFMQKAVQHATAEPASLGKMRPDLPAELIRVIEKMMAKAPSRRYQTPAEAAAALEPFTSSMLQAASATEQGTSTTGVRHWLSRFFKKG